MEIKSLYIKNEVKCFSEIKHLESEVYLAVRKKEKRIIEDEEVIKLPYVNYNEWPIRKKSSERFLKYLSSKSTAQNILDLGCGNGWFSNQMALVSKNNFITGIDINVLELEQGARVFKKENLQFVYGDIFEIQESFKEKFDLITLNGVIQYFPDFLDLINILKSFLNPFGEIHIIDSPFYKKEDILKAKKRTLDYYTDLGFSEMAKKYFHHDQTNLIEFKILYSYKQTLIYKILRRKDSPFIWCKFKKHKNV